MGSEAVEGEVAPKNPEKSMVVKANAFVEAAYSLNMMATRVLLTTIAQVDRSSEITETRIFSVSVEDLRRLFPPLRNASGGWLYRELKKAADELYEAQLVFCGKPNEKPDRGAELDVGRWVQRARYIPSEGRVELRFAYDVLPFLQNLSGHFLQYDLQFVARMGSPYSVRMYELLASYRRWSEVTVSLEDLRRMLRLEDKYPAWKDFRRRIIQPTVDEINAMSDMRLSYKPVREAKWTVAVCFQMERQTPPIPELIDSALEANPEGDTRKTKAEKPSPAAQPQESENPAPAEYAEAESQAEAYEPLPLLDAEPMELPLYIEEPIPSEPAPEPAKPQANTETPPKKTVKKTQTQGTRLPDDWVLPAEWREWAAEQAKAKGAALSDAEIEEIGEVFADHWRSKSGKEARKLDWLATWRNWVRRELQWKKERAGRFGGAGAKATGDRVSAVRTAEQMAEQLENEPEDLRAAVFGQR
ncbi:RepB family plasmid replication initiator protein [Thioalkalivibrio sp. ALMg11]|uniref:RepB family plasmid replication initiator protein n=1 Tax=Thioalkalivibrio sp. ALMg11 TaxID=1158165 RepID=UPI0003A12AD7|nr:RepB family plasmid replication initiator protein [Thioalkalivibrio sp. ALMg11]